jgi:hypothetical protein
LQQALILKGVRKNWSYIWLVVICPYDLIGLKFNLFLEVRTNEYLSKGSACGVKRREVKARKLSFDLLLFNRIFQPEAALNVCVHHVYIITI